jgi:lysophospholipase L1-like esterase
MKKAIVWIFAAVIAALCVVLTVCLTKCAADRKKAEEQAAFVKAYTENKLSLYAKENAESGDFEVVFLGDSLTDGCDLAKYYGDYSARNRGIGGDTTSGLIDRMQVSAYDAHPRVIVLLIGGNDILGGRSVEEVCKNYETIVTGIRQHLPETKIVWCSLTVMGKQWAKHNETVIACNQRIRTLAGQYGCAYADLFTPLCDPKTHEIFEEYTVEGVHPTDEGYKVVSAVIREYLRAYLGH